MTRLPTLPADPNTTIVLGDVIATIIAVDAKKLMPVLKIFMLCVIIYSIPIMQ